MYWNRLNDHLKSLYGTKVYKLALSSGCSCPNRDGTLGSRGCSFCDGAGAFAEAGAIADQIAAAKKRVSTYFIKCHDLLQQLKKAKLENRLESRLRHFCHYRWLIIDEIGYLPIDKEDSNLFFQLIDKRYEKKSTIFTTNMNFNNLSEF